MCDFGEDWITFQVFLTTAHVDKIIIGDASKLQQQQVQSQTSIMSLLWSRLDEVQILVFVEISSRRLRKTCFATAPPRFFLTVSVRLGRDNSIRWGTASGPTDAAIRLQNSGDKIKWCCGVCNTINCPTRCRVCNAINGLLEIPTPASACDWDYKLSPPDEIKMHCLRRPDPEIITHWWRIKQKKDNNAMKWKSHLFNLFSPSSFWEKSY